MIPCGTLCMCFILEDEKQIHWQTQAPSWVMMKLLIQHLATHLIKGIAVNTCLFLSPWKCWCCSPGQFQDCSRVISAYGSLFAVPCRWPTGKPKLDERFLHPWYNSEGSQGSQELARKEDWWARYGFCQEQYIAELLRWVLLLLKTTDGFGQRCGGTRNLHFHKRGALQLEKSLRDNSIRREAVTELWFAFFTGKWHQKNALNLNLQKALEDKHGKKKGKP